MKNLLALFIFAFALFLFPAGSSGAVIDRFDIVDVVLDFDQNEAISESNVSVADQFETSYVLTVLEQTPYQGHLFAINSQPNQDNMLFITNKFAENRTPLILRKNDFNYLL